MSMTTPSQALWTASTSQTLAAEAHLLHQDQPGSAAAITEWVQDLPELDRRLLGGRLLANSSACPEVQTLVTAAGCAAEQRATRDATHAAALLTGHDQPQSELALWRFNARGSANHEDIDRAVHTPLGLPQAVSGRLRSGFMGYGPMTIELRGGNGEPLPKRGDRPQRLLLTCEEPNTKEGYLEAPRWKVVTMSLAADGSGWQRSERPLSSLPRHELRQVGKALRHAPPPFAFTKGKPKAHVEKRALQFYALRVAANVADAVIRQRREELPGYAKRQAALRRRVEQFLWLDLRGEPAPVKKASPANDQATPLPNQIGPFTVDTLKGSNPGRYSFTVGLAPQEQKHASSLEVTLPAGMTAHGVNVLRPNATFSAGAHGSFVAMLKVTRHDGSEVVCRLNVTADGAEMLPTPQKAARWYDQLLGKRSAG